MTSTAKQCVEKLQISTCIAALERVQLTFAWQAVLSSTVMHVEMCSFTMCFLAVDVFAWQAAVYWLQSSAADVQGSLNAEQFKWLYKYDRLGYPNPKPQNMTSTLNPLCADSFCQAQCSACATSTRSQLQIAS